VALWEAVQKGEHEKALQLHHQLLALHRLLNGTNFPARVKAALIAQGVPAGRPRRPLTPLEILKLSPLYKWVYGTADKDSFVTIDRAKAKLGWQPRYSNAEALCRTYDWYLAHKDELRDRVGVTHRVAWSQGALRIVRDLLPSGKKATTLREK